MTLVVCFYILLKVVELKKKFIYGIRGFLQSNLLLINLYLEEDEKNKENVERIKNYLAVNGAKS